MEKFDVMVIGGGVVGLSAAIAMRQREFNVGVIDAGSLTPQKLEQNDLRVYAINQASGKLLKQMEAWEQLDKTRLSPYSHMHIWDSSSSAFIDFDARMIAKETLGTIVEESNLKTALLQKAALLSVSLFAETKVTGVRLKDDCIHVQGGEILWETKLLIVADGANSFTRELLGVQLTSWSYNQDALVANVETELPHQKTAYQVFNPSGPLAFLPLANENQCSIVWSLPPARAENLLSMTDADFITQLNTAFGEKLGKVKTVSKRCAFPLTMRHAKQYSGERWILMGDAAHTIHPLAGLGLNVGLGDLDSWLEILDQNKNVLYSRRLLGAYQRQRKYEVWQIIALMQALKTVFANPLLTTVRGFGLTCLNRLSFFKRFFIKVAG